MTYPTWTKYETKEYIDLTNCLFSGQIFSFTLLESAEHQMIYASLHATLYKNSTSLGQKMMIYEGTLGATDFYLTEIDKSIYFISENRNAKIILDNFFMADLNYQQIFLEWRNTPFLKSFEYNGLRLLHVSHIECIFSFICSQNNNIKRITKMVLHLKKVSNNFTNLTFCEQDLKLHSFGYRAKYILDAAIKINAQPNLASFGIMDLRKFLLSIKGIGNKVCDCILLMGYKNLDVVPIDVHIFRVSNEIFDLKYKSLTKENYKSIQEEYKRRFGKFCGIAQLYYFKKSLDKKLK